MSRNLKNIRFTRVALVDKGANFDRETNDGAHILLWKRDTTEKHVDSEMCKCADCMAKRQQPKMEKRMKLTDFLKKFTSASLEKDETKKAQALSELSSVEIEVGETPVEKGAVDPKVIQAEVEKAAASLVQKNADLEKRLKDAETAQTETANLLKREREQRLDGEMISLLKSFKATPFNLDEKDEKNDIKKFRKMQDSDPEGFARIVDLFKAADLQLAQSAMFKRDLGSGQHGATGSAEAQLIAKADGIIAKSAIKMTKEQAFEQACLDNPELVKQYRAEQQ